ncbi:DUF2017 family protein [Cellulomonas aerilata]|uniref:Uncharacterized protein n=1 Tax=Cellulomonas aerilata TaxID=515326 RepID=A0A512DCK5_9CELL|nr:DUF2017 family protein [Cellulomonas aerilata]GEO34183.1 hypothetical protein CAE01nite_19080 [Cellulomonas aerilata]
MRAFRPAGGYYVAGLDRTEREVFATVVADVAELLGAERFRAEASDGEGSGDGPVPDGAPDGGPDAAHPGVPPVLLRMSTGRVAPPDDPAVRRLLPDASRDDDEVTAEFRRLTDADLRSTKIARLRDLWTALDGAQDAVRARRLGLPADDDEDLVVPRGDAQALAAGLTDVRLVLAERLGLRTEEDADRLYETLEAQAAALDDADELDEGADVDDDRPAREIVAAEVRAYLGSVYAALTWLQESLMALLLADLDGGADGARTGLD